MKRWKKILLVLVAVVLLAQIPFVYNRFQTKNLSAQIAQMQSARAEIADPKYNEYKGIIHAHTFLGGHSTGNFEDLIAGASASDLDFVVMTEHFSEVYDTSALTLNGFYGKTLFVGGNEVDTASGDRFLLVPGSAQAPTLAREQTTQFLEKMHAEKKLALVTYPEKFKSWDSAFDGVEAFSLHTNAKKMNPATFLFDALWSYGAYPELTLAQYFVRPDANLKKFDETAANRKITLFAGTDAHSNIGFHILGDDAGNKFINFKFDDYQTIFRLARAHVLLEKEKPLTRENLTEAIGRGNMFVGFDILGDSRGFSFTATSGDGTQTAIQGDEIVLNTGVKLTARAPLPARFVIFRNGEKVFEEAGKAEISFDAREKGAYRTEVYLDTLGRPFEKMPWIFSNPIYVR